MIDGEHERLKCSGCGALVVDLWLTNGASIHKCVVQAQCCFCGDTTQQVTIQGGFHYGPIGRPSLDEEDDIIPSTTIIDMCRRGEVFLLLTKKAKPDSKPIYR